MCFYFACMYVCALRMRLVLACRRGQKKVSGLWHWSYTCCEPMWIMEIKPKPLQEQYMFLPAELSLQPLLSFFIMPFKVTTIINFILCIWMFCFFLCITLVPGDTQNLKKALKTLELELSMIVNYYRGTENQASV